jgi:hypothetical protein
MIGRETRKNNRRRIYWASYLSPTGRTIQNNSALWNILAENQNNQQKNHSSLAKRSGEMDCKSKESSKTQELERKNQEQTGKIR